MIICITHQLTCNANKFIGDGSALTNLPNDNVWKDNGSSIEYKGDGSTTTQVWAENNGKYAKVIQKNDGKHTSQEMELHSLELSQTYQ